MNSWTKVWEANSGALVLCDLCNQESKELGGIRLGSNAICPECASELTIEEEDKASYELLDQTKTFVENVHNLRYREHGTKDCIVQFYTMEW